MLMFLSRKFEFPIIELICINKWFFLVFPHQMKNASRIEKNGHGNEKRNDKSGIIVVWYRLLESFVLSLQTKATARV